ncbi:hypothetical protein [Desulfatiglans anilini]|uniref:hypothetical protein n=1 Tax=Desulfatiglans anilini TaxID=90728 RepID=UPI0003F74552|nr:hypothetical protein [Desulfatiglans anilini]
MTESVLDRGFQREMLLELQKIYPNALDEKKILEFKGNPTFRANINYLREHRLVQFNPVYGGLSQFKITAEGLDFLAEDGGLTAIKRTITVRPDVESFLNLLKEHAESLPPEEKGGFLNAIGQFSKPILQGVIQGALTAYAGKYF